MSVTPPSRADPEIAAATFKQHLEALWATERPQRLGWERTDLSGMHTIIRLPAHTAQRPEIIDHYFVRLGAEYYDAAPPTVALVEPELWTPAGENSKWWPRLNPPNWFGLHAAYGGYHDGITRPLVCFSMAAEYYLTDHSPTESQRWKQGRHTMAATLYRLAKVLAPPHYLGRSA